MLRRGSERVATGNWCRGERGRVVEITGTQVEVEVLTGAFAGYHTTVSACALEPARSDQEAIA